MHNYTVNDEKPKRKTEIKRLRKEKLENDLSFQVFDVPYTKVGEERCVKIRSRFFEGSRTKESNMINAYG